MTPERWQQVKDCCNRVLECEPQQREARLLELCCGDQNLQWEVEAMLAQATGSDGILEAPVWQKLRLGLTNAATVGGGTSVHGTPERIGRYRILRLVGEGGMGTVYEAEQDHPQRTVALKVIRQGLISPQLLRRFELESQALGRLQHPGIAQIYEAGTAGTGFGPQPYFAMEFIRGETLREHAASHQLSPRQRLELMTRICDAVEHAHQRGLIHRDLKPGNILVDQTGQPKILDFGVARLTDSDAQATRQTDLGQLVGTLAYMSPEQVLADPLDLDTRSDVYTLGVILYELLAGKLPYIISNKLHEAVRTIREEDPTPLTSASRSYQGDVETIVAKALEKDKARRYASAAALGEDIRRYLGDKPIDARPATTIYQLQKFARRHRPLVGGVMAVFLVLAAGGVVSTWQAVRARRAEAVAIAAEARVARERDEANRQRNNALTAQAQAQEDRNRAIAAQRTAGTEAAISKAVSEFLQRDLLGQASARAQARPDVKPDPDLKVRTALDRAAARIGSRFKDQPLVEASIRHTIGTAYQDLGLYPEAEQHLERVVVLRTKTLGDNDSSTMESLGKLAGLYMLEGKYRQAEPLYLKVVTGLRRAHGERSPNVLEAMSSLAELYLYEGRYAPAEALLRRVVPIQRGVLGSEHPGTLSSAGMLARTFLLQGKLAQAESLFTSILESDRRVLGREHPDTLTVADELAQTYESAGKYNAAETLYLEVLAAKRRILGGAHQDTLSTMGNLAFLYKIRGRYAEAEPLYNEVVAVRRRVLGEDSPDTLNSLNNLGALYVSQNRFAEAAPLLAKVLEARRRILGADHPNTLNTMANLAQVCQRQGKMNESGTLYSEILATRRRVLGQEHPDTLRTALRLATIYTELGRLADAELLLIGNMDAQRRANGAQGAGTLDAMERLAGLYLLAGKNEQAQTLLTDAFDARSRVLGAQHPSTIQDLSLLGLALLQRQKYSEVESLLRDRLSSSQKAPETWSYYYCQSILGAALGGQQRYAEAESLLLDGYRGLADRAATIPLGNRTAADRAVQWIVQLYQGWDKPERAAEWSGKLPKAAASQ